MEIGVLVRQAAGKLIKNNFYGSLALPATSFLIPFTIAMALPFHSLKMLLCIGLLFVASSTKVSAQTPAANGSDVWQSANKSARGIKEKGAKKLSAVKRWKDHLKQWGLDSNYTHSLSLSGRLASDGYGGGMVYKVRREGKSSYHLWQLRFNEVKGEKEVAQQRDNTAFPQLGQGTPYIFGKLNNLYTLQLGYGRENLLLPGILEGNVSIGFRYGGGFLLAMLKPYYLNLLYVDYSTSPATAISKEEAYADANKDYFLNPATILGKGRWKSGLNAMEYIPGIFGEAALVIEPGKGKGAFIQTITLGLSAAFYNSNLTIMAEQKAYPFEGCLFATLELGKRWK